MSDESEIIIRLTKAMREADESFESVGGSTRHYVRECLLPILSGHGLELRLQSAVNGRDELIAALNGFIWLGNNLHNITDAPAQFRSYYEAALADARAALAKARTEGGER